MRNRKRRCVLVMLKSKEKRMNNSVNRRELPPRARQKKAALVIANLECSIPLNLHLS